MLQTTSTNTVQAIRAFQPEALKNEAAKLMQHFLYVDLSHARSRTQVFRTIAQSFHLPVGFANSHENLRLCLTKTIYACGPQNGFVIVLEHMPNAIKFGTEAREKLLDVFRDIVEFWAPYSIPCRVFYSHSVPELIAEKNKKFLKTSVSQRRSRIIGETQSTPSSGGGVVMRSVFDTNFLGFAM